jgi:hypothetical protein
MQFFRHNQTLATLGNRFQDPRVDTGQTATRLHAIQQTLGQSAQATGTSGLCIQADNLAAAAGV